MSGAYFNAGLRRIGLGRQSLPFRLFLAARNWLLTKADAFVAISAEMEREFLGQEVASGRIRRIPNGVDTRRFRPVSLEEKQARREALALPRDGRIAVYTGRLVSYKGLPLLLGIWPEVRRRHPDAYLVLAGSGGLDIHNCEPELRSFVAAQGLDEGVLFAGEVGEVEAYLQAADVFVFPSEREGLSLALLEAMACGLPCVTTTVGGLREIVVDGRNALAVEPGDGQPLCAALSRLLADPELAARLGRAARATVGDRYAMDRVVAEYAALFGRLMATQQRSVAV
jgi:glycosyltransferase involved in cell wall biosynthesis